MSLRDLPTEILLMIVHYVTGTDTTRRLDLQSLAICKRWYYLAESVLLESITIPIHKISRISRTSQQKIALFTRHLSVDMGEFDHLPLPTNHQRLRRPTLQWKGLPDKQLVSHLDRLRLLLLKCSNLESFALQIGSHFHLDDSPGLRDDILSSSSPSQLLDSLWPSKITRLEIDTGGIDLHPETDHLCPQLALQIPSLRYVRLRLRQICPDVLRLHETNNFGPSRIEELIINLSLADLNQYSIRLSSRCSGQNQGWALVEDMIVAARAAVKETASLKVLKIVCYVYPNLQSVTHDCVADVTKILAPDLNSDSDCDWAMRERRSPIAKKSFL